MKVTICVPLFVCALLTGCGGCIPEEPWDDKDVDSLIAKLESWRQRNRIRAVWTLKNKTEQRDKVIAALTHTLLNDTHERVRSETAHALNLMTPPAVEAVPALIEALHLPPEDRGKPHSSYLTDVPQLLEQVQWTLELIGTPEALQGLAEWRKLGPKLIESSVLDGASGVDAEYINEHGITLRFRGNRSGSCHMLTADGKIIWRKSFEKNAVTFKPRPEDQKLVNGTVYTLKFRVQDDSYRFLLTTITFVTKE